MERAPEEGRRGGNQKLWIEVDRAAERNRRGRRGPDLIRFDRLDRKAIRGGNDAIMRKNGRELIGVSAPDTTGEREHDERDYRCLALESEHLSHGLLFR
ncbi:MULTISPECIES: hypothetical protein [Novosphingobium]|jgi:hypothetical protein|nr:MULTISPECIES: hypothetical protein [Novosphingobium]MCT2401786.1 hypothetical protein [Novosphingobium mangrovi (ex Huang et al. 2023)]